MAQNKINMPAGFGGLLRYSEEYKSKFMLKPAHIVAIVIAIVLFVIVLNIFFPLA